MKIVYISRSILPSRTANSINVMKMCNTFASLGHEVILLAPWTKKLEEKGIDNIFSYYGVEENFTLRKLYSPSIKYLKKRIYSWRCLKVVQKENPDLVYGRDDMLAFYLTLQKGFKTVFERHEPYHGNDFNDFFFKKFIDNSKDLKLVVNSNELKKMYHNSCKIPLINILAANNGTNFIVDNKNPDNVKIDSSKIQVGYVGSLFKGRGIDIIVELAKRIPEVDFHIIGGKDKDLLFWKSKVDYDNLIFHGFVEPKETYKYRNMCDILLAPYQSDNEGNRSSKYMSPIKLFEYMSSQKVIICSNFKVVYEALDDTCAVLVDSENIDMWEDSVRELINNKEKRDELSLNAFNKFKDNFTWASRVEKILNYISGEK